MALFTFRVTNGVIPKYALVKVSSVPGRVELLELGDRAALATGSALDISRKAGSSIRIQEIEGVEATMLSDGSGTIASGQLVEPSQISPGRVRQGDTNPIGVAMSNAAATVDAHVEVLHRTNSGSIVTVGSLLPSQVGQAGKVLGTNGSVASWVDQVRSDFFDIRDYGAVGDGITDDGPAIQLAINAASFTGTPPRAGTVYFPPTIASWRVATALNVSLNVGSNSQNTFRLLGCSVDGPIMVDLDNATDFLTWTQQGEWFQSFIEHLAFMTSDSTQATVNCRDLINADANDSYIIIRDCHDLGVYAYRSKIHTNIGNFIVQNWHDGAGIAFGTDYAPLILCDKSASLDVDNLYTFWQGQFRGVSYSQGTYSNLVHIIPMDSAQYDGNHDGTQVTLRKLTGFVRTNTMISCVGDATHIARSIVIRDSFFNSGGGDVLYFDSCGRLEIDNCHISCGGLSKIEFGDGAGITSIKVKNLTKSEACTLQLSIDHSVTAVVEFDNAVLDKVVRTSGFTPSPGPLGGPIYVTNNGLRARIRLAGAAMEANTTTKFDSSGKVINLTTTDDVDLFSGVAIDASSGDGDFVRCVEQAGQQVSIKSDGVSVVNPGDSVQPSTTTDGYCTLGSSPSIGVNAGAQVPAVSGDLVEVL